MKIYNGRLDPITPGKMTAVEKRAYGIFRGQRVRCSAKQNFAYKWYGAKNIRVEYNAREFIGWYLEEIKKFKGNIPSVGRVDHDKNYCFGNIEIQELSENSRERMRRLPMPLKCRSVVLCDPETKEPIMRFTSIAEAAKFLTIDAASIGHYLAGKSKKTSGVFLDGRHEVSFQYADRLK